MLGHQSATVTLDLYGPLLADQLDEVADAWTPHPVGMARRAAGAGRRFPRRAPGRHGLLTPRLLDAPVLLQSWARPARAYWRTTGGFRRLREQRQRGYVLRADDGEVRWSSVATSRRSNRSVSAMTDASTVPNGRSA